MTARRTPPAMLFAAILLFAPAAARADGFIVVPPADPIIVPPHDPPWRPWLPLVVREHRVTTRIDDLIARTRIEQTFYNPASRDVEGTYIFALPDTAAVEDFTLEVDGRILAGEVLDADTARRTYEDIVRRMRDPALLEYVGARMFRARIFPIPAGRETRVILQYRETLTPINGTVTWRYPLNTERFSAEPLRHLVIDVTLRTTRPLHTVFCSSHDASVERTAENSARITFSRNDIHPTTDFFVHYHASPDPLGLALLTHRLTGEDGYFMARIAPPPEENLTPLPKDVIFVLDTSGSMHGPKIRQALEALRFCLDRLDPDDRFGIVAFASDVHPFRDTLLPATRDARDDARAFLDRLQATGGTNIHDALATAIDLARQAHSDRPAMLIFLTDGQPTVGQTDVKAILTAARDRRPDRARLFVFGVGHDVNTWLLDSLARDLRGAPVYVAPDENLELRLADFYTLVSEPVLADIALTFGAADVYDLFPSPLPDLFRGTELIVFGRYRTPGEATIELTGTTRAGTRRHTFPADFPSRNPDNDFLARLWALQKVTHLVETMRLHGESDELKQEIIRLGKRYAIITPYTSFLITEEARLARARGESLDPAQRVQLELGLSAEAARDLGRALTLHSGADAVALSQGVSAMKLATPPRAGTGPQPGAPATLYSNDLRLQALQADLGAQLPAPVRRKLAATGAPDTTIVRRALGRTFYRDGDKWIDADVPADADPIRLTLFSEEYFDLLRRHPAIGRILALGPRVVFVWQGRVYQTQPPQQRPHTPKQQPHTPEQRPQTPTPRPHTPNT